MSERVLVIDFDRRECQRLAQALRDLGYEAATATSGAEVRDRLSRGVPGLVLLDPMLPGEDGFKLCRDLKRPDRPNPPKIVVASRIFKGQRYRTMAERSGADVFLERPRQEGEIISTVQRLLPTSAPPPSPEPEELVEPEPSVEIDATELVGDEPQPAAPAPPEPAREPAAEPPLAAPSPAPAAPAPAAAPAAPTEAQNPAPATHQPEVQPERQPEPPKKPAAEVPGFAVSDDDIDDALERALGGSESGPVAGPAPPPAGGRPAPTINTAPQRASRAGQPAAQREEPAASAWTDQQAYSEEQEQDDLNDALDDLGIEVAAEESRPISRPQPATQAAERPAADGPAVGVLESPLAFEPPAESGAAIERRENAGTASELELQADLAPAEPEPEPPPAAAPSVPAEPPRVRAEPAPPRAEPAPPRAEPASPAGGDDLDVMLDRAFQGGGPAAPTPAESEPPLEDEGSGPPPFEAVKTPPAPKVPDSLKGMDEGTADLLSSLEELDSSLPSSEPTGWTSTGLTEDVGDRRDDDGREQAPTPEEEASLDAVMERLTSTGIGEEQAPEPGAPASDGSQAAEPEREQPAPQGPPRRKRKIKLGWLFSFFVGMIAVGVSGSMLLLEGDEGGPLPTQIAEQPRSQAFAAGGGGPPPPQPTPEPATAQVSGPDAAGAPPPAEERSMRRIPEEDPVAASPTDEAATEPQTPTPATRPAPRTASLSAEDSPQDTRADPEPARTRAAESGPVPKPAVRTEPDSEPVDPAPSSAEANPAPVQPTPVVGLRDLDQPLNLIESPTPRLAPEAREQGISGRVFVNLLVGPEGTVREVRVMIDPGYGLGQAARDAAARWRYTPPRSHGRPVRVWKTEVVEFDGETPTDANG